MFRLLIIALLVVGVSGLTLAAQEKAQEKGPDPKEVTKEEPKAKDPPKVDPPKDSVETYVQTPHWTKKVPLDLVQVAMSVIIAALLALAVSQLSGLKSSIDKLAEKMGGGGA